MGPMIFLIPLGLIAVVAAAAAGKKKAAAAAPPAGIVPTGLPTGIPGAAPPSYAPPPTFTVPSTQPTTELEQMPADIAAMVTSAVNSGNPETMRRVAVSIRPRYPNQANWLESIAANFQPTLDAYGASTLAEAQQKEAAQNAASQALAAGATPVQAVQAAQTAATAAAPAPPLSAPPAAAVAQAMALPGQAILAAQTAGAAALAAGATPTQAILAAQNAATMTATPGVNAIVAQAAQAAAPATTTAPGLRPEPAPAPMPSVPLAPPTTAASNSGKQLAADVAKALLTAKKGTSSEPRALIQAFQTQERLTKTDGSYGAETALALADRYGIVPPKPLYWGKKGGPPDLPAKEKQSYSAHMLVLASQDPQRADEWRSAAKV